MARAPRRRLGAPGASKAGASKAGPSSASPRPTSRSAPGAPARSASSDRLRPETPPAWRPGAALGLYWPLHLQRRHGRFVEEIESLGGEVHLYGGALRDRALGRWPQDYDLVCVGVELAAVQAALKRAGLRARPGRVNPVLRVLAGAGSQAMLEITAMPRSVWDSPERALKHDFTLNALSVRLAPRGEVRNLSGWPGAVQDLEARVLRPLQMGPEILAPHALRGARLMAEGDFALLPEARALLEAAARSGDFEAISRSQRGAELTRVLLGPHASGLEAAFETGVLARWLQVDGAAPDQVPGRAPPASFGGPPGATRLTGVFGGPDPRLAAQQASLALSALAVPQAAQRPLIEALVAGAGSGGLGAQFVGDPEPGGAQHAAQLRRLGLDRPARQGRRPAPGAQEPG